MTICIFDTSIASKNLGDFIIMESVHNELNDIFENNMPLCVPTHEKLSNISYDIIRNSTYRFVGGTNLLSSNMAFYNQWKINFYDSFFLNDVCLMGVGWWQYQNKPDVYSKYLYRRVLSKTLTHSVRDDYTKLMLEKAGLCNVINTGCPTMWGLNEEHCEKIPNEKAGSVVFTLTDYNKDIAADKKLYQILKKNYEEVYFWPQGTGDLEYFNMLFGDTAEIKMLMPNLRNYNQFLSSDKSIDFVGTRLHAGIKALQKKRRTVIISIDNRAEEKSKNFNLPVVSREKVEELELKLQANFNTKINLPIGNINLWKSQFNDYHLGKK